MKKNMYKGVSLCYSIITVAYITIGITGYWAFGNAVQPFILANLTSPSWVITFANALLIVQVVGCYQVSAERGPQLLNPSLPGRLPLAICQRLLIGLPFDLGI